MHAKRTGSQVFLAVFVAFICLHVILVSTMRLYPFIDMPNHLTAATIYRYFGDKTNFFSSYYALDLFLKPNVFHLLFCGLPVFGSVELANHIFFALYVILFPLSVLLLMRKLGGNQWFALLSFLLLYNYNIMWGFVGFAFAVPLILLFLKAAIDFIERGRWNTGGIVAGLLILLFFVHALAAFFALVLYLVYCLLVRKLPVRILERCIAIAPATALIIVWWNMEGAAYRGQELLNYLNDYYNQVYFTRIIERLDVLHQDNSHLFLRGKGTAVAILFSLCIIAPVIVAVMHRRRRRPKRSKGIRFSLILFIISLACTLVLPHDTPNQAFLFQRFSVILFLSLILLGGCLVQASLHRALVTGICVICAIHFALWADYFRDFNDQNRTFTPEFLPPAGDGRILAGIIANDTFRGKPVYIHFPSYFIIWRRGIATTSIVDYRFGSVRRAVGTERLPKYFEWAGRFKFYDGRYRAMDFILIRGDFPVRDVPYFEDFALARTAGRWSLYERKP